MYNKEWKSESRELNSLIASEYNPRRLTKAQADQLKRSIAKFGLCEPIVIQPNGSIIGGHQRAKILKSLGHTTVNVYVPTEALSPEEANELNIRLNKNTGEWDYDVLANMVDPDELMDFGFTPKELDLEVFPEEAPSKQKLTINIKFDSEVDFLSAREKISKILMAYPAAKIK
jgi:ParB-like chromosome segregation protein Spo0J